uniref:Ephrin RBD domain-containing protein n=1 Tax=Eptatretus burgeri TaxID=7764 RepID=A0A8C4NC64_EPTBU
MRALCSCHCGECPAARRLPHPTRSTARRTDRTAGSSLGCSLLTDGTENYSKQPLNGMDYALHVNIGDYVEFFCPHSDKLTPLDEPSNLLIHQVRRSEYNTCNTTKPGFLRFNCDRPQAYKRPFRHVEKIQRFTPFSLGVEFYPGKDYYYISAVLEPGSDKRCLRLKLSVCCKQDVTTDSEKRNTAPDSDSRECMLFVWGRRGLREAEDGQRGIEGSSGRAICCRHPAAPQSRSMFPPFHLPAAPSKT